MEKTQREGDQAALKNQVQLIKTLIHEKYTQEYKLDRKTRQKAEEILKDYYQRNPEHIEVSLFNLNAGFRPTIMPCTQKCGSPF